MAADKQAPEGGGQQQDARQKVSILRSPQRKASKPAWMNPVPNSGLDHRVRDHTRTQDAEFRPGIALTSVYSAAMRRNVVVFLLAGRRDDIGLEAPRIEVHALAIPEENEASERGALKSC